MEEQAEDGAAMRKVRTRRSVLTDISNKIVDIGSKLVDPKRAVKKRRISGASDTQDQNIDPSTGDADTVIDITSSQPAAVVPVVKSESAQKFSSKSPKVDEEIAIRSNYKITRKFPLKRHGSDPSQCFEILDQMYEHLYDVEDKFVPRSYIHAQEDLNYKMRSILIDWLLEVHFKFKLVPATLWLCVSIMDRFLSRVPVKRTRLQLTGIAAFFIACKMEEVYPPEAKDFVHVTDNAYTHQDLLQMETEILVGLNYEIIGPTGYHYFTRYLNAINASENTRLIASYYAERSLQESHMLDVKPRVYAAAAVYGALLVQKQRFADRFQPSQMTVWDRVLQEESGLSEAEILPCVRNLLRSAGEEPVTSSKRRLIAAKRKYSHEKFQGVALLDIPKL